MIAPAFFSCGIVSRGMDTGRQSDFRPADIAGLVDRSQDYFDAAMSRFQAFRISR